MNRSPSGAQGEKKSASKRAEHCLHAAFPSPLLDQRACSQTRTFVKPGGPIFLLGWQGHVFSYKRSVKDHILYLFYLFDFLQPVTVPESSPFDVMALYDFHGNQQDGELVFTAGEIIHVIEKINDDWLKGEYRGRSGAFPCSFVDISTELINKLPQSEQSATVPKSDEGESSDSGLGLHCKALFDYDSEVPDDLSFHAGDVIKIKKKISEEWFKGEINGREGMFPAAYVEIIKDMLKEKNKPGKLWQLFSRLSYR